MEHVYERETKLVKKITNRTINNSYYVMYDRMLRYKH